MKYSRTVFYLALNITLIVWITFVGVGSVESSAQAPMDGVPRSGPQMPDAQEDIKKLTKKLKLTGDQTAQVVTIVTKKHTQIDTVMRDESQAIKDKMQQAKKITTDSNAVLRTLLTAEQQKKFDKIVADSETEVCPPDGMPGDGPPGDGLPPPPFGGMATYNSTPSDIRRPPLPQLSNTMLTLQESRS
jgi:hypothetical protein